MFQTDELSLSSPEDENRILRSEEDRSFDEVIGHIEDLLLGITLFWRNESLVDKELRLTT